MLSEAIRFYIPPDLRKKYVSSKVSREIFFIDCINDLNNCARSELSYNLIRSSVLLRMLLLDGVLKTISKEHNIDLLLKVNENEIQGIPFTNKEIRDIKETIESGNKILVSTKNALGLQYSSSKSYSIEEFNNKICLKMTGDKDYCFSVSNIIQLIANKHGAAHLESTFELSTLDSFCLGDYSPFSLSDGSFFLEKIKEIILILVEATNPLIMVMQKKLIQYNRENAQGKISKIFKVA